MPLKGAAVDMAKYMDPTTTALNVENDNEEIWHKVRARATVTTNLGEGTTEFGQ